ncbi:MAG TPA: hypothetical protein VIK18_23300, partial [Pirellulales bacterium]
MASIFGKKKEDDFERTRIILSFAMANHGSAFGHWLRNQLMLHYGLFGVKSVYLDSVVCRSSGEMTHGEAELKAGKLLGMTTVCVEEEG